jgi:hypothetical protein
MVGTELIGTKSWALQGGGGMERWRRGRSPLKLGTRAEQIAV